MNHLRFKNITNHIKVRAQDLSFVLDKVQQMQNGLIESKFKNKLDLSKVGALGGSLGGPTVMLFGALDKRCLVTANLDGSQFGIFYHQKLNKPHIHFDLDLEWKKKPKYNDWENIGNAKPYFNVMVRGASHGNLGDQLYSSSINRKKGLLKMGPIKPKRIYEILDNYLLAYFGKYLKGEEPSLLKSEKRFKEVKFIIYE